MNRSHLLAPLVLLIAGALPLASIAQPAAASSAASAASAPVASVAPKGPRLLTPKEKRDNAEAAAAPDLRPDRPVVPQIRIPLGRKPAPAATAASGPPRPAP
jgi:hypothetical protein